VRLRATILPAHLSARIPPDRHPHARVLAVNDGDLRPDLDGVDAITDDPADVDVDVVLLGAAGPATGYAQLPDLLNKLH
jgi:hypothetical protein